MNGIVKVIDQINLDQIKSELSSLPVFDTQMILQSHQEDGTDHTFGTGAVNTLGEIKESSFKFSIFDIPYINSIIEKFGLYRTRAMRMKQKTCYSYHNDFTPRIHIPVVTNPDCFFVIEDVVYKLPADGSVYLVNTTLRHTFVNASWDDRIHIVGCQTDTDEE